MTVRIEKPAINVREELADLRKPTGLAGEAMLRAETPQEQFNLIGAGRRNMLINGDFSVWQRGTSGVTGYTSSAWKFAADRWKFYTRGNTGVGSFTKSTTQIDGVSHDAAYFDLTTGNTVGAAFIAQYIEGVAARGKHITFSLWYEHVTGEYPTIRINGAGNNVSATLVNGWNAITTKASDTYNADALSVGINVPSANPCGFKFTHAQLELGKVATPFEHRSYGEELALCQRFYYKSNRVRRATQARTDRMDVSVDFPVTMRATPTVTETATVAMAVVSSLRHADGCTIEYVGGVSGSSRNVTEVIADAEL